MTDMLVNLLRLPPLEALLAETERTGARVRRAQTFEMTLVRAFVTKHFSVGWADEISAGFHHFTKTVMSNE